MKAQICFRPNTGILLHEEQEFTFRIYSGAAQFRVNVQRKTNLNKVRKSLFKDAKWWAAVWFFCLCGETNKTKLNLKSVPCPLRQSLKDFSGGKAALDPAPVPLWRFPTLHYFVMMSQICALGQTILHQWRDVVFFFSATSISENEYFTFPILFTECKHRREIFVTWALSDSKGQEKWMPSVSVQMTF